MTGMGRFPKRLLRASVTVFAVVAVAAPSVASNPTSSNPAASNPTSSNPTAGGLASDNVTYVGTVPFEVGGAPSGARLVGDYLYVAGARSFSIYDVSDPLAPALESITPTGPQFPNEDVDTNGKILLIANEQLGRTLQVWDVENKSSPQMLAQLENIGDHTFTCVLRCAYAYGSRGSIVDLRDPAAPKLAGGWGQLPPNDGFDTTEVSPGMVLTASRTITFLDGRKDILHPKVIALGGTNDRRLIHSLRWPNQGKDRFFLVQGETPVSQTCDENSGAFMTWDTAGYRRSRSFSMVDEFRVTNGNLVDGNPPANASRMHGDVVPRAPRLLERRAGGVGFLRARDALLEGRSEGQDLGDRLLHARRWRDDRYLLDHRRDRVRDRYLAGDRHPAVQRRLVVGRDLRPGRGSTASD